MAARSAEPRAPSTGCFPAISLQFLHSKSEFPSKIVSSEPKNSCANEHELDFILRDSCVCSPLDKAAIFLMDLRIMQNKF